MAQAGGRDPEKLPEALATARAEIEQALAGLMPRILALDHGDGPLRLRDLRPVRHARHAAARRWSGPTRSAGSPRSPRWSRSRAPSAWSWACR